MWFLGCGKINIERGMNMIEVTRLNDHSMMINAELIEMVESNPDTTITMTTGRKIIIKETVEELVQKVVQYKQKVVKISDI
jgi:flagellar protein FlbD